MCAPRSEEKRSRASYTRLGQDVALGLNGR